MRQLVQPQLSQERLAIGLGLAQRKLVNVGALAAILGAQVDLLGEAQRVGEVEGRLNGACGRRRCGAE